MINRDSKFNPWSSDDEKEHKSCLMEWWAVEAFFKSEKNNKKWSLKVAFTEWFEKKGKLGSISNITLFDQDSNKHYVFYKRDDKNRFKSDKNAFFIQFEDSFMKGAFPCYEMCFVDTGNDIKIDLKLISESYPHWIAQDVTDGWLPMGLGLYRYGFIPYNKLTGSIRIKDEVFDISGIGYFEHVWGDFDYDKPLNLSNIKKLFSTNFKLILWWISNRKIKIPKSMTFSTDNNAFGYDWVWAVFDNNWTLFYGNSMFWIMDGPGMGSLILSKDGKNYLEFNDFSFSYKNKKYVKKYDFYYPTELEICAKKGLERVCLNFKMDNTPREYISIFPYTKLFWYGLCISESPGVVEGYYFDGEKKTHLSGLCKIEPQREISSFGHNMLEIGFIIPPSGLGFSFLFESHYFLKKLFFKLQFFPKFKISFKIDRIDLSKKN